MTGSLDPGINRHAPDPQGPGFPRHEPSVNATAVSASQFSIRLSMTSLDNFFYSAVVDFDEPKFCQYSGVRLVGCKESRKLNSFYKLCREMSVLVDISATWIFIFPNGEIFLSAVSLSRKLSQLTFRHASSGFIIILAACLTASSSLLILSGLTPAFTSKDSREAVRGTPRHIASPFLYTFSKPPQSPICQTAAAYSNCDLMKVL